MMIRDMIVAHWVIGSLLLLQGCAVQGGETEGGEDLQVLAEGNGSAIVSQRFEVIHDESELAALWQAHTDNQVSPPQAPAVNWDQHMVIAVFLGEQATGGYRIRVHGVEVAGDQMTAHLEVTQPGSDRLTTQALSQPYQLVAVARSQKPVSFHLKVVGGA